MRVIGSKRPWRALRRAEFSGNSGVLVSEGGPMTPKVLYIIHNPAWTDCRVADTVRARGYTVDHVCPAFGDELPPIDGYAALMAGGSEEGHAATPDDPPWVALEIAYIRQAVDREIPYYGICMGCQLLAGAYGGEVSARPDGLCELGFYRVGPTDEGRSLFGEARYFYQAHFEGVMALPREATLLASGESFPVQAFRIGDHAYGTQFHPDAKLHRFTREQIARDSLVHVQGAQDIDEQVRQAPLHEPLVQEWTERLVDRWIGPAEARAVAV